MGRLPNYYKQRSSGYVLAYEALCKSYLKIKKPLSISQAEKSFECTPCLIFNSGTRTEDVLKTLLEWKVIVKFLPKGQKEEQIVPLEMRAISKS